MELVQYFDYFISIVDIDVLVLKHHGISSSNAEYPPMISSCLWVNFIKLKIDAHFIIVT